MHHNRSTINDDFDDDVVVQRVNQIIIYSCRSKTDFHRPSTRDGTRLPFDCYLILRDASVAVDVAVGDDDDDGFACVHWSLVLNGYYYETRWNDSLTVRCYFGDDNLDCVLQLRLPFVHDGSDNGVTFHFDNYFRLLIVQNAVTGFPDYLWPYIGEDLFH